MENTFLKWLGGKNWFVKNQSHLRVKGVCATPLSQQVQQRYFEMEGF